jgi:hypothetical protein
MSSVNNIYKQSSFNTAYVDYIPPTTLFFQNTFNITSSTQFSEFINSTVEILKPNTPGTQSGDILTEQQLDINNYQCVPFKMRS